MNHIDDRVRERAYSIWLDEGMPEGRADLHWGMASELVAIEANGRMLRPNPLAPGEETLDHAEPVEPIETMDNLGEFPTLTDQGEERTVPTRRTPAAAKPAAKRVAAAAKSATRDARASSVPAPAKRVKKPVA